MADSGSGVGWRDPSRVSVPRSLWLMAAGGLVGLGLAGHSLFTARGTSTLFVPADAVALVNQQPISRVDYTAQLQTLYGVGLAQAIPEQRQKVLHDMIREELLVQRGRELDVASSDPDVRSAMVNAVEQEIAADALTAITSEQKLREYYQAHAAKYSSEGIMSVRDFLFPASSSAEAATMADSLRNAATATAALTRLQESHASRSLPEEFYFAAQIHLGDALFAKARDLADGAASAPVNMPDGVHVLYMDKNTRPVALSFETARDRVLTDYRNDAIARLRASDEAFLTQRANIQIAGDMR